MNNKIKLLIAALIIFALGFFLGMEYKAYQVRSALTSVLNDSQPGNTNTPSTQDSAIQQAKKEGMTTIDKAIGDEISLATIKIKVNSSDERQTISSPYSSPKVAKQGTKFVVINLDVTNTTNSEFSLQPDFLLVDNQNREYSTYSDSIGSIDNYLNYRDLSPSVKETGFLVYEIPADASSYSLMMSKAGTKELYKIKLK